MKKYNLAIMIFFAMLITSITAFAEAVGTVEAGYDWAYLGTTTGATVATLLITQFLKLPLDKVWKIPTRIFVYIIAFLIMLGASYFTGAFSGQNIPLLALNAFIVSMAAMGSYELTFKKTDNK